MVSIPLSPLPSQLVRVVLGGQDCTLSVYQKGRRLFLDLAVGEAVIRTGALCQNGADAVQCAGGFAGSLHFIDTMGASAPQWQGLGGRYLLLYAAEGEELPEPLRF